jgi:hypothetical protein
MSAADGGADERHEIKFAAYATEYRTLQNWLRMHPAAFMTTYPDRQVNNIYFDTWDYRAYAENLAGVSERSKLRYRWYGDSAGPAPGTLEVKKKRNHFGWKQRYKIDNAIWEPGLRWKDVRSRLNASLPQDGQLWLAQNPMQVMLNRYQREYLCTADGLIRATIDWRQKVFDQRSGSRPNLSKSCIMQNTLVVEFKFAREDRQLAVNLLGNIPVRIGRHSKYMNAVRSIAMA